MAVYEYATIFRNQLLQLYGHELKSVKLFSSNADIQIVNGKDIKIPKMTVSGYKDHSRDLNGFNKGKITNGYETKQLDHDRDIEFGIDPLDVDETNLVVSIANVQKKFDSEQAIPELDKYTFSKLYAEYVRAGGTASTTAITKTNVLSDLDDRISEFVEAGVPLDRLIMYCTPAYYKILKNADGIQRTLEATGAAKSINRNVYGVDDLTEIVQVPSDRFKTIYDFTEGAKPGVSAKQINYIIVDPEAQVSRNKYSYIKVFTPGTDSRTADNYLYQNRRFNGTFALDELIVKGCAINVAE